MFIVLFCECKEFLCATETGRSVTKVSPPDYLVIQIVSLKQLANAMDGFCFGLFFPPKVFTLIFVALCLKAQAF